MAKKRMFALSVVQSSRFLKMPVSSRELYFQLGMSADDDGIVEAWNVIKLTNAREDDLRVLISKGYVQILDNEDLIAYLTDWNTNNTIRADRYQEGIYKDLKLRLIESNDNQVSTKWQPNDNQMTTNCQPNGNQVATQYSIDKYSIDKVSIDKNSTCKHKYGEYKHVLLSDRDMELLHNDYEDDVISRSIKILDEYIEYKGAKYKNHYLVMKKWVIKRAEEELKKTDFIDWDKV